MLFLERRLFQGLLGEGRRLIGISPFHLLLLLPRASLFTMTIKCKKEVAPLYLPMSPRSSNRSLSVLLPCFLTKLQVSTLHSAPQSSCLVLNGGRDRNFDLISLKGAFLAHHSLRPFHLINYGVLTLNELPTSCVHATPVGSEEGRK